jgi:hypothetical protein
MSVTAASIVTNELLVLVNGKPFFSSAYISKQGENINVT